MKFQSCAGTGSPKGGQQDGNHCTTMTRDTSLGSGYSTETDEPLEFKPKVPTESRKAEIGVAKRDSRLHPVSSMFISESRERVVLFKNRFKRLCSLMLTPSISTDRVRIIRNCVRLCI